MFFVNYAHMRVSQHPYRRTIFPKMISSIGRIHLKNYNWMLFYHFQKSQNVYSGVDDFERQPKILSTTFLKGHQMWFSTVLKYQKRAQ